MSTTEQREHNGRTILDLCELGDRILESYGIAPQRAKVTCQVCSGCGCVPANSGSDISDVRCQECNGKGVL